MSCIQRKQKGRLNAKNDVSGGGVGGGGVELSYHGHKNTEQWPCVSPKQLEGGGGG